MDKLHLGFKIENIINLRGWRWMEINDQVPLEQQNSCPADNTVLKTICSLVSEYATKIIRIGTCPDCGYTGFIDRPTAEWVNDFYLNTWGDANENKILHKIETMERQLASGYIGKEREIIPLLKKTNLNKERYVCEIGCGFGKTLKQIELLGYKNLIGIENSKHRAFLANKVYGLDILTGAFESENVQNRLKAVAPLGLVFSYHVLEHVYNPKEILEIISKLQDKKDFLIISVPNVVEEVSMAILAFLPHLHSFSERSIFTLLAKNGYQIIDDSLSDSKNINVLAQKTDKSVSSKNKNEKNYPDLIKEKFLKGLGINKHINDRDMRFWWFRKEDIGGQLPYWGDNFAETMKWKAISWVKNYRKPNSLLVSSLKKRYVPPEESPLEIQFKGPIKLFYK